MSIKYVNVVLKNNLRWASELIHVWQGQQSLRVQPSYHKHRLQSIHVLFIEITMSFVKSKLKLAREALGKKEYPNARDAATQVLEYEPDNYNA